MRTIREKSNLQTPQKMNSRARIESSYWSDGINEFQNENTYGTNDFCHGTYILKPDLIVKRMVFITYKFIYAPDETYPGIALTRFWGGGGL